MKAKPVPHLTLCLLLLSVSSVTFAGGAGTSTGLTLLEPSGARAAALGETLVGAQDDITAFGYNPGSLSSLSSPQASFSYQKGLADDAYGSLITGMPTSHGSIGLSVGYYDGGKFQTLSGQTVKAKTDMTAGLGYSMKMGRLSLGVAGKYISSEIIEASKATAFAGDLGLQLPISHFTIGAAVQNIGTKMKYEHESDDLPSVARLGFGWHIPFSKMSLNLLGDLPYYLQETEIKPAVGLEGLVGPLALRAGYKSGNELQGFTFGAGFNLGRASLDYSYGLVENGVDDEHRMSVTIKFGEHKSNDQVTENFFPSPKNLNEPKQATATGKGAKVESRIYFVQPGDTLSLIAYKQYGDYGAWRKILEANNGNIASNGRLVTGQKVVLP